MNGLKDLKFNGLKNLKIIGLKNIRIDGLKNIIFKPQHARDTDIKVLTKSREEIKRKIRELVREKKEIESQITQLQKTKEEKDEEISGSTWKEKKGIERTDNFDKLKKTGEDEKIDNTGIKTEVIEAKPESKTNVGEGSGMVDLNNSFSKKVEEVIFPIENEKTKIANSILQENGEDRTSETSKTENGKLGPDAFKGGLIEELLENEDLYPEEEKSFMKYIGESSVAELVTNLKEIKQLLA